MREDGTKGALPSCEEVDERIEDLADGALGDEERRSLEAHLRECPACRAQLEAALAVREELEAHFARIPASAEELERTAVAATVRAFNAIEASRREAPTARRKRSRMRRLVLLGGWAGAILVGIRAIAVAEAVAAAPADVAARVAQSPALAVASRLFDTTPAYFVAGLALLALALGYSLRAALQRD